jgi:hypothetical protein
MVSIMNMRKGWRSTMLGHSKNLGQTSGSTTIVWSSNTHSFPSWVAEFMVQIILVEQVLWVARSAMADKS